MKKIFTPLMVMFSLVINAQTFSPVNPAYTDYLSKKTAGTLVQFTDDGFSLGEIPEVTLPQFSSYKPISVNNSTKSFPALYDLRTLSLVTSVKNQNPYGTCWAHAAMGAIESNWLKTSYGTYNLSESNMATCHGFEWGWNDGGNRTLAGAYVSRISGPVSETDDAYSRLAANDTLCHSGLNPVSVVANVRFLPNDMDVIKQAVTDYGAIYTNYYHDNSYYNSSEKTYYCPDDLGTNHAVLIVGWDDNKTVTSAPGNGAWIIKTAGVQVGENRDIFIFHIMM